jgi:SOS-response transcriptional repressor LexA
MSAKKNHLEISPAPRIKQLRLAKGLTQKAFSDSLGIVQGYLSGIESGRKIPSHTLLMALCHIHGVREEWLYRGSGEMFMERRRERHGSAGGTVLKTPLLKGLPKGFPHSISDDEIVDYIQLPDAPEGCFALKAEGDFMAPTIRDGDLVIFRPGQEMINRSIVLLSNRWGEVIMRRARLTGREVFFSAENTVYAPFHPDAETNIFGTVVSVWRNVKII